jgi:hypothetical protein
VISIGRFANMLGAPRAGTRRTLRHLGQDLQYSAVAAVAENFVHGKHTSPATANATN